MGALIIVTWIHIGAIYTYIHTDRIFALYICYRQTSISRALRQYIYWAGSVVSVCVVEGRGRCTLRPDNNDAFLVGTFGKSVIVRFLWAVYTLSRQDSEQRVLW